jgi:hypothetical protein
LKVLFLPQGRKGFQLSFTAYYNALARDIFRKGENTNVAD